MPKRDEGPSSEQPNLWAAAGEHTGLGLTLALSTLFFLAIGWWLDSRLGTTPWLLLVGALIGAAAGFYFILSHTIQAGRRDERNERGEDGAS